MIGIKVITFQNKIGSENILSNEVAYPSAEPNNREWRSKELEPRDEYFSRYNESRGTSFKNFFWGFTSLIGNNCKPIDLFDLNGEQISNAVDMIGLSIENIKDYKLFSLEVPNELVLETDFYDYTDSIFDIDVYPLIPEIFNPNKSTRDVQAIFPFIRREWICDVKCIGGLLECNNQKTYLFS